MKAIIYIFTLCTLVSLKSSAASMCQKVLKNGTESIAEESLNTIIGPPQGELIPTQHLKSRGSQVSFFVADSRGQKYFLKESITHPELQTAAEVISSHTYRHFGYYTPEAFIVNYKGNRYSASALMPEGKDSILVTNMPNTSKMRSLKVLVSFLYDYDRIRTGPNNRILKDDSIAFFDMGGTLGSKSEGQYRLGEVTSPAIGSFSKPNFSLNMFNEFVGEHPLKQIYDHFNISKLIQDHPWHQLNESDVAQTIELFRTLDLAKIREIVALAQYSDPKDSSLMVDSLITRRDIYLDHLGSYLFKDSFKNNYNSYWASQSKVSNLDFSVNENRKPKISTDIKTYTEQIHLKSDEVILFRGQSALTEEVLSPLARKHKSEDKQKTPIEVTALLNKSLSEHHYGLIKNRQNYRKYDYINQPEHTRATKWWDRATAMDSLAHTHSTSDGHPLIISTTRDLSVASRWIEGGRFPTTYRYVYILKAQKKDVLPITDSLVHLQGSHKEAEYGLIYNATNMVEAIYDTKELRFIEM